MEILQQQPGPDQTTSVDSTAFGDPELEALKAWAESFEAGATLDPGLVADLRSAIIHGIHSQDHPALDRLRAGLTPAAARLRARTADGIPEDLRQAAELCALAGLVHGALFLLERDDPHSAVKLIPNGRATLQLAVSLERQGHGPINLQTIIDHWDAPTRQPSKSTLSRSLAALEQVGFVRREGATRGMRIQILPRAHRWYDTGLRPVPDAPHTQPEDPGGPTPGRPRVKKKTVESVPDFLEQVAR